MKAIYRVGFYSFIPGYENAVKYHAMNPAAHDLIKKRDGCILMDGFRVYEKGQLKGLVK